VLQECAYRRRDVSARQLGLARREASWHRAQPALHLAQTDAQGALTTAGAGEEVVPASELRAAHQQIRELQRLLGKKTLENKILREAVERVTAPKKLAGADCRALAVVHNSEASEPRLRQETRSGFRLVTVRSGSGSSSTFHLRQPRQGRPC
jgi:hypothetical protein